MYIEPLHDEAVRLCQALNAPECLIRHLTLVHDVANKILYGFEIDMPGLHLDTAAIVFGAATHDLGKVLHPTELTAPGRLHEQDGPALLQQHGVPKNLARFARTHGTWSSEPVELEDLLVALADKLWKGHRDDTLENEITRRIATALHADQWHVFKTLDEILTDIADQADERLAWQRALTQ